MDNFCFIDNYNTRMKIEIAPDVKTGKAVGMNVVPNAIEYVPDTIDHRPLWRYWGNLLFWRV